MKTVLITGASGFFGKSFIEALGQESLDDHQFVCIANIKTIEIQDPRFKVIQADLLDTTGHQALMEAIKPTHCVHLAWHVPPQDFWNAYENVEWLYASVSLFKAFCDTGGKVFIGAGTIAEYDWKTGILDEEKTPLMPNTFYGQCKKSLYEILTSIRNAHYKNTVLIWPRIGYFFGSSEPSLKLISRIIDSIKTSTLLKLVSKETRRPYAHVRYLGKVLAYLLLNQEEDLVFNLSANTGYTLEEIVNYVNNKVLQSSAQVSYDAYNTSSAQPITLEVKTLSLEKILKSNIQDTFFEDLKEMIEANHVKV
jgi:nucleoside-diphosphate-sugar epimerase